MVIAHIDMKMLVLLMALVALINPTISSNEQAISPSAQEDGIFGHKCPRILKEQMAERVVEHLNVSGPIKSVLEKSAVFIDCVASKFCLCMDLRFEPLIYGCFGAVGGFCMKRALIGHVYGCTLDCVNNMIENNSQRLDDGAIGDICYRNCMKNVN